MREKSHSRLAQILQQIEDRCAGYQRHPLAAAQAWADDNACCFGRNPLDELITAGVRYCQLYCTDKAIGCELRELGNQVEKLGRMRLTELVASAALFDAVYMLKEFAHGMRIEIELSSAPNGVWNAEESDTGATADLVDHQVICEVLEICRKTFDNYVSKWPKANPGIHDPCSYAEIRPMLITQWPKKSLLFPKSFVDFKRILIERKSGN